MNLGAIWWTRSLQATCTKRGLWSSGWAKGRGLMGGPWVNAWGGLLGLILTSGPDPRHMSGRGMRRAGGALSVGCGGALPAGGVVPARKGLTSAVSMRIIGICVKPLGRMVYRLCSVPGAGVRERAARGASRKAVCLCVAAMRLQKGLKGSRKGDTRIGRIRISSIRWAPWARDGLPGSAHLSRREAAGSWVVGRTVRSGKKGLWCSGRLCLHGSMLTS